MQQFSLNLGLDVMPISQDPDAMPDLMRLYNAVKLLAGALDEYTGALGAESGDYSTAGLTKLRLTGTTRIYVLFSEAVTSGQLVTLYNNAGVLTAKKAGGGTWAGLARGFVLSSVSNGAYGEVFLQGANNAISGMTPGTLYYTSDVTAGAVSTGATTPHIQPVGIALSANTLWFTPALETR